MDHKSNVKPKTIRLTEKTGENSDYPEVGNRFLGSTQKPWATKKESVLHQNSKVSFKGHS